MKQILEIINELKATTKTNEKIAILTKNKDNELLQKDKKTGLESLQFPVFVRFRNDKTEPSYN